MRKLSRREVIPLISGAIATLPLLSFRSIATTDSTIQIPKGLKKGDFIGICAPAGIVKSEKEISEFEDILHRLGFKTKRATNSTNKHGYFAGTDKERAEGFMKLIQDKDIRAVFFIRGGWGCARLLPHINFETIAKNPKIIMGFSDATTLLNAISVRSRLITFHGPSGNSTWNDYSLKYIEELLIKKSKVKYENKLGDAPIKTYSGGQSKGALFGGNLSVITSLIGSGYLPDWNGKIVFLEDVKEEPYRIDRMLMQMKLNGVFDQVNGIILGNFRKCFAEEPEHSFTLEEIFEDYFMNHPVPVFYGAQIGHTLNKFTLPIGADVLMDATNGTIQLIHPAVK